MHFYEVLKRPISSEKSNISTEFNKYTFEVDRRANKSQVKEAVEKAFGVKVIAVNIMNMPPKRGRWGRWPVQRSGVWKKAVVTLAPGERISVFEGV
jgi:large subunit ribosomal protein L23